MKTFPRLLSFLALPFFTVALLFAASEPAASPHSFGLYLVEVAPSGTSDVNTPLADLILSAEPLISERDIASYDWESHTIHLKQQEVADRVLKPKEMSRSRGFVVVADGQRLYRGTLLSPVANSIPDTPVIHFGELDREYELQSAVRIYPPMISGKPDTRSDPRLKRVLEALQLLRTEPGVKSAALPSTATYGPVIERFIAAGNGDKSFYSIERDAYVPGPKDFPALPSFEDFAENESAKAVVARYSKWLADNDVDCVVQMIASQPGLTLSGMKLQGTFFEHFDDPAAVLLELFKNDLRPQDRLNLLNLGGVSAESRSDAPDTVFFQTRNGRVGVAQFVGRTENPRGVTLRYKLVQNAPNAAAEKERTARVAAQSTISQASPTHTKINQLIQDRQVHTGYDFELFEKVPGVAGEYRIRNDIQRFELKPGTLGITSPMGAVYFLTASNRFYIQWDALGASTIHYYGPFDGDPAKVLGLSF